MDSGRRESKREAGVIDRRGCLAVTLAAGAAAAGWPLHGAATPDEVERHIESIASGAIVREGRVAIHMPKLAENGLSVPLSLSVESPMTTDDHVRTVHILAEHNPIPVVARFHFNARSGRVRVKTRIRLADTQDVVALAEMSDGSVWLGKTHVVVTLGGCIDPVL